MFVDRIKIYVKAGSGGNGCISFLREKYLPKGGPNGGNGGDGASVILRADKSRDSLVDLKYQQHVTAKGGEPGQGSDKHGATAEDMVILVPPGTLVMDLENDCYEVADLDEPGAEVLVAQGGLGGRGNKSFATSTNRAPRKATPGGPGEERTLLLELKTIADAGLVGYPHAGKSTLLRCMNRLLDDPFRYTFQGKILLNGKDIYDAKRDVLKLRRKMCMIFQEPNLLPWMNVYENIKMPLKILKEDSYSADEKIYEIIKLVGLEGFERYYPKQLSGGMSMRVSIARALVTQPKVLLMDEPFSALDETRRFELSQEILKIKKEKGLTVVYVTHSIYESVYLSDRIYVMQSKPGKIYEEFDFSGLEKNEDYRFTSEFHEQAKIVSDSLKRAQNV